MADGGEPPGLPRVWARLCPPRKACGVVRHGSAGCWHDDRRRRGGTDALPEPAEVRWPPRSPAGGPAILLPETDGAPTRRGLQIMEGLCPRPAQVPDGVIRHRRARDRGEGPCAHAACPCEGVPPVGCAPIASLLGEQGGRHDPTDMTFFGQRAVEPVPTGTRLIDKDERAALRLHLTNKFIDVTLTRTNSAEGNNLGVVFLGNVRHGYRLFMDIQSDVKRARL